VVARRFAVEAVQHTESGAADLWERPRETRHFAHWLKTSATSEAEQTRPEPSTHRRALANMRVRVWIHGADGASRDFELVEAPRVGERISIAHGTQTEDGVVAAVTWNLQAIEAAGSELSLEAEPVGAVSVVHVLCHPQAEVIRGAFGTAKADETSSGSVIN